LSDPSQERAFRDHYARRSLGFARVAIRRYGAELQAGMEAELGGLTDRAARLCGGVEDEH